MLGKNAIPVIQVFRHRELAQKIAGLTEDIEELKSEKTLLLGQFDCSDDRGMREVKQWVASMETLLEKLNQGENKYTVKLNEALVQYAELQHQASDVDTMELEAVCQAIRPNRERETVQLLQAAYGKQLDSGLLAQSRKDVAKMLDETAESVSIQQNLQQLYKHQDKRHHVKKHDQER